MGNSAPSAGLVTIIIIVELLGLLQEQMPVGRDVGT